LDGLRGIAILMVVTYHYFAPAAIFSLGWTGVDLFFVLSGFLITGKLCSSLQASGYFRNFYRNRILRIVPLYYAVLGVFYVCLTWLVRAEHLKNIGFYGQHWMSFLLFTENWSFLIHGNPTDPYLQHFWSLAVEEQFYLVWPLVVLGFAQRKSFLKVLFGLFCLALILRGACDAWCGSRIPTGMYYLNPFFKMDSFVAGGIVYVVIYRNLKILPRLFHVLWGTALAALALIIYAYRSCSMQGNPALDLTGFSLIAVLYACLLYRSLAPGAPLWVRFLSLKPLRFIGRVSYGLYIFHWPVLLIFEHRLEGIFEHRIRWGPLDHGISIFLCLVISALLSVVSFYFFESYFLSFRKKTDARLLPA
jgi:peptidoglycan/LPS O-acetylase OafA/YrhL